MAIKELTPYQLKLTNSITVFASVSAMLVAAICHFSLNIEPPIPIILTLFAIVNLINTLAFKWHKSLKITYAITAIFIYVATLSITLVSGGISSSFIFFLPTITISGYAMNSKYGRAWMVIILISIIAIYLQNLLGYDFDNCVHEDSRQAFSFLSLILVTVVLGGVLGDFMSTSNKTAYLARKQVEIQNQEKEVMLKEIHHRVKNNLQIITSLLNLQSNQLADPDLKEMYYQTQHRIQSMALVHEMLYNSKDLAQISYDKYVRQLAANLLLSIHGVQNNITLDIDVPKIRFTIDTAIALGIIMTEIITNSLKHGVLEDESGTIRIKIRSIGDAEFELIMSDDGNGYSHELNGDNSKTLGLQLIESLSDQLSGRIERIHGVGTHYKLIFKDVPTTHLNTDT